MLNNVVRRYISRNRLRINARGLKYFRSLVWDSGELAPGQFSVLTIRYTHGTGI